MAKDSDGMTMAEAKLQIAVHKAWAKAFRRGKASMWGLCASVIGGANVARYFDYGPIWAPTGGVQLATGLVLVACGFAAFMWGESTDD